jgi:hypothetical protein
MINQSRENRRRRRQAADVDAPNPYSAQGFTVSRVFDFLLESWLIRIWSGVRDDGY